MSVAAAGDPFASESSWPFLLNQRKLEAARAFLTEPAEGPRVLRVFGSSGTGKSFLVRELLTQLSSGDKDDVGLYLDVPAGEYEASTLPDRLALLLSNQRTATRDAPSFVGRKVAKAWASALEGGPGKGATYAYQTSRELSGQLPVVGPFVKGLIPQDIPRRTSVDDGAPIRFLMRRSVDHQVVLAIDNVQFMPFGLQDLLDAELSAAGSPLRLVLIERTSEGSRLDWRPPIPGASWLDLELGKATTAEVAGLIAQVLPDPVDDEDLAASVVRRSDGNLKSVWFQLRLIAARRTDQEATATSYEDVISTLTPLDQAVLRLVVFTIGGLTVATLAALLQTTSLRAGPDKVTSAVADLASLGLLVVNGDHSDRVRVEHELVARVVTEITPEDEKLELRAEVVAGLSALLDAHEAPSDEAVLYDRFLGIVNHTELRQEPSLLSHVVRYVQLQSDLERYRYLAGICRDSVCWDVLDVLPDSTVRSLLDAIQKSSLFSFGLVATRRLQNISARYESLASLYEAKYLVQLFQFDEAQRALDRVTGMKDKRLVAFNMLLVLAQDDKAAEIAMEVFSEVSDATGTEQDYVILRNSGHLFPSDDARAMIDLALDGFRSLGRAFGYASTLNNRGVVELADGRLSEARMTLGQAYAQLLEIESVESYQPLVNFSALSLLEGDLDAAQRWLIDAQELAPRSLMQDDAMFEHNSMVLAICDGRCSPADAAERMHEVVKRARRTRDLRFIDLVCWLDELVGEIRDDRDLSRNPFAQRIDDLRRSDRLPLEVFVPARFLGRDVEVPFVLSPNWRY